jgi:hypothetical protein
MPKIAIEGRVVSDNCREIRINLINFCGLRKVYFARSLEISVNNNSFTKKLPCVRLLLYTGAYVVQCLSSFCIHA